MELILIEAGAYLELKRQLSTLSVQMADFQKKMTHLMTVITAIGFCDEKIPIYVATDLKLSKQHLDEDEFIDVEEYTIDEIKDMIFSGKIIDAKTISGVLGYLNMEK